MSILYDSIKMFVRVYKFLAAFRALRRAVIVMNPKSRLKIAPPIDNIGSKNTPFTIKIARLIYLSRYSLRCIVSYLQLFHSVLTKVDPIPVTSKFFTQGFYTVYRKVFDDITDEEQRARAFVVNCSSSESEDEEQSGRTRSSSHDYPTFGHSDSNYADVVAPFYQFWETFRTHKNYTWVETYDIRCADSRQVSDTVCTWQSN